MCSHLNRVFVQSHCSDPIGNMYNNHFQFVAAFQLLNQYVHFMKNLRRIFHIFSKNLLSFLQFVGMEFGRPTKRIFFRFTYLLLFFIMFNRSHTPICSPFILGSLMIDKTSSFNLQLTFFFVSLPQHHALNNVEPFE